ncbi:MAG: EAL domain-containing protein [Acidimicrobiales bacterium]
MNRPSLRTRIGVLVALSIVLVTGLLVRVGVDGRTALAEIDEVRRLIDRSEEAAEELRDDPAVDLAVEGLSPLEQVDVQDQFRMRAEALTRADDALIVTAGVPEIRREALELVASHRLELLLVRLRMAHGETGTARRDLAAAIELQASLDGARRQLAEIAADDAGAVSDQWRSDYTTASELLRRVSAAVTEVAGPAEAEANLVTTLQLADWFDALAAHQSVGVAAGLDEVVDDVREATVARLRWQLGAAAGAMLLIALAGVRIGRSIARPVRHIAEVAEAVRSGRLDVEPIGVSGPRELALVGAAIDDLVQSLGLLQRQALAIGDDDLYHPVLRRRLPGPLGEVLDKSMDRWRRATISAASARALSEAIDESTVDAHLLLNEDLQIVRANPAAEQLLERPLDSLMDRTVVDILALDDGLPAMRELLTTGKMTGEIGFRRRSGEQITMLVSAVRVEVDERTLYALIARDITDRKLLERRLRYRADHDELTGLHNRASVIRSLELGIAEATRTGLAAGVIFFDLDGFKQVNDVHGHAAGDHLLRVVTRRVQAELSDLDVMGRIGGDELVVVLSGIAGEREAADLAHRLRVVVAREVEWGDEKLAVTGSFGVAATATAIDAEELIGRADVAVYASKAAGRNRVTIYRPGLGREHDHQVKVRNRLPGALGSDDLEMYYQPIVDCRTGELVEAEALLRWQASDGTSLAPGDFVPVVEGSDLVLEVDEWVLRRACRQLASWGSADWAPRAVAVNISARHMGRTQLVSVVQRSLREAGLDAARLVLEITETAELGDPAPVRRTMELLKELGLTLVLDDFGTGSASLTHVHDLPVDGLKIDRSFVSDLPHEGGGASIVASVVDLAASFGLTTVAEGIEREEQLVAARDLGCTRAQGYLLSRPLPAGEFESRARTADWTPLVVALGEGGARGAA